MLSIYFSPSIFAWNMKLWLLLGSCVSPQPSYPDIHVRCFQSEDPVADVRPQEYLVCSEFHLQPNKIQVLLTWAQLLDCVWPLIWMLQQPCMRNHHGCVHGRMLCLSFLRWISASKTKKEGNTKKNTVSVRLSSVFPTVYKWKHIGKQTLSWK